MMCVRAYRCYLPSLSLLFDQLIKSNAEYDAILRANSNTLVVIKFFAPWCRSCKALGVKYRRMAVKYEKVTFVEVREKLWFSRKCAVQSDPEATGKSLENARARSDENEPSFLAFAPV